MSKEKKMSLRDKLREIAKKQEYKPTDEIIFELLIDGNSLKEYAKSKHRWYTTFRKVIKIDNIYVDFLTYSNSGDEPALDKAEWMNMVFKSIKEVYPKEITTIDYVEQES